MTKSPVPGPGRPSAPFNLGMVSIVLGVLGTLGSVRPLVLGAAVSSKMVTAAASNPEALAAYVSDTRVATLPSFIANLVMSIALIGLGIGQRRYRRWAVLASRRWAALAAAVLLAAVLIEVWMLAPIQERFVAAVGQQAYPYNFPYLLIVGAAALKGGFVVWMFRTFGKPEVVAAMDQPPQPVAVPAASVVSS